jgi:methionyl-tRNA formyltransferase
VSFRVIFMGTPECATPYLAAIEEGGGEVVAVVTQPDQPAGRGRRLCAPPVKEAALARGLPVIQGESCRDPQTAAVLAELEPEVVLVVAFGEILCPAVLEVARGAILNVHYSLLPAFRGAAPVQRALLAGLSETGVTLQHVVEELDAGDIVAQTTMAVAGDDDVASLTCRLTVAGCELVRRWLAEIVAGTAPRRPQNHDEATLAPKVTKAEGALDFSRPASELVNRVRAMTPWPGAYGQLRGKRLMVRRARVVEGAGKPGEIIKLTAREGLAVATGNKALELLEVQAAGKRAMTGAEYVRGARLEVGEQLQNG